MSDRRLILLADRFPNVSRMTLFRIAREPDFPISSCHSQQKLFRRGRTDRVGGIALLSRQNDARSVPPLQWKTAERGGATALRRRRGFLIFPTGLQPAGGDHHQPPPHTPDFGKPQVKVGP